MIFDLHVHTNFSDGLFTPEQIIDLAIKKKIDGIAITDHDTIYGIESAIQYSKKFKFFSVIPGIEFGCIYKNEEVHILGYFTNYKSSDIINAIKILKKHRFVRGLKMIEKINTLDMELTLEEVKAFSKDDNIGRPHVARALIKRGYVDSMEEAFNKFLYRGKPGYVERKTFKLDETIKLIQNIGGVAILAHPGLLKNKNIINYCISSGINGLEVIHSKHNKKNVKYLLDIAKQNDLIITGGSDFHGNRKFGEYLLGQYYINIDDIPKMKGMI